MLGLGPFAHAKGFLDHETYTLTNGMTVILHQDSLSPFVTIHVRYRVGAFNDPLGRSGLAHLFEHLLFRSSDHLARNNTTPDFLLSDLGARSWNGSTGLDETDYYEVVPAVNLEAALWMESDRMGFPDFSSLDLNEERKIVHNERRQRREIAPYGLADQQLWQTLFPAPHPYHFMTIGAPSELENIRIEDIKAFHKQWYTPSNAILTLSGDFSRVDAHLWIEKYFGTLPTTLRPEQPVVAKVEHQREIVIHHRETVGTLPRVTVAWLTPPTMTRDNAAFSLLALLLTRGRMGKLRERVIPDHALSIYASQQSLRAQSVFRITASSEHPEQLPAIVAAIDATLSEIAEHGVSDDEMRAVRKWVRNARMSPLQSTSQKAELLSDYMLHKGKANYLGLDMVRYQTIVADQIQQMIRQHLKPTQRVVLYAVPDSAKATLTAAVRP